MARTRTIQSAEADILKVKSELIQLQNKYDGLTGQLSELEKEKRELEANQIIAAYEQSDNSLEEVLTFLGLQWKLGLTRVLV